MVSRRGLPLRFRCGQKRLRDPQRREDVYGERLCEPVEIHVQRGLPVRADNAGIVDQDVDGAVQRGRRFGDGGGFGHVEDEGLEAGAKLCFKCLG